MNTDSIVFSDYLAKFITNLQEKGKSSYTITAYKKDIEQFLGFLAKKQVQAINEIKKETIQEFITSLLETNSPKNQHPANLIPSELSTVF